MYWLSATEVAPGRWKLDAPPESYALDARYEYRTVFDADRGLWRIDKRVHVPGS